MGSYIVYGDESYIHSKNAPCYGLGCFLVPADRASEWEAAVQAILSKYRVTHELKWNRINDFRAEIEASYEAIAELLRLGAQFFSIIVWKEPFRKWRENPEEALYMTYTQLAVYIATKTLAPVELRIDQRSDHYPRRAEVLRIIANHMLSRVKATSTVSDVVMVDSRAHRLLQLADVLLGAITADTNAAVKSLPPVNQGKRELISRLAALVGWKRLYYDTYPNTTFNVWHFPPEFRSLPAKTREVEPSWLDPIKEHLQLATAIRGV